MKPDDLYLDYSDFDAERERVRKIWLEGAAFRGYALRCMLRDGLTLENGSFGRHAYAMAQVRRHREQSKRWVRRLMELAPLALIRIRTGHPPSPR